MKATRKCETSVSQPSWCFKLVNEFIFTSWQLTRSVQWLPMFYVFLSQLCQGTREDVGKNIGMIWFTCQRLKKCIILFGLIPSMVWTVEENQLGRCVIRGGSLSLSSSQLSLADRRHVTVSLVSDWSVTRAVDQWWLVTLLLWITRSLMSFYSMCGTQYVRMSHSTHI